MPLTLQCPRKHTVPFTEDDRGGEVYCPVCSVVCPVPPAEDAASADAVVRCGNGHVVAFTEDDRGGEVYCRSCGILCQIPEAAAKPAGSRRAASVFSTAGAEKVAANVAGSIACPRCTKPVSYTVAEYGETVFCTHCGIGVIIGESLYETVAARAQPAETGTTPVRQHRRRNLAILASLGLLVVLLGTGFFISWKYPESLPFDATVLPWNKPIVEGSAAPVTNAKLTPAVVAPPPPPRPDLKITMDLINKLALRQDLESALADAQHWQWVLSEHKVPPKEPRVLRLNELIADFQKKLQEKRPPAVAAPPTPAEICLTALNKMRDAIIKDKNAASARKFGQEVEKLLAANPELAKRHTVRYEQQKGWLRDLEDPSKQPPPEMKRPEDVEALLTEARKLAVPATATRAMELRARAMFLAPAVALDDKWEKHLNQVVKDLTNEIHKARGLRAVADAERCLKEGDDVALKMLVGEALRDLPEFTAAKEYKDAYKLAEAYAKRSTSSASGSDFGKTVLFRHDYEEALDAFRDVDLIKGVAAADRARQRAPDAAAEKLLLEFTHQAMQYALLTAGDGNRGLQRRKDVRTALEESRSWLGDDRWKQVDSLLKKLDAR